MALRLTTSRTGIPVDTRIDTPRLLLRAPAERDWEAWAALREESRGFLTRWEPAWPADVLTKESYRRRVRRYHENWRTDQGYAVFFYRREDTSLVGGATLANVRRGVVQSASLGYWVGRRFARQGYTHEALQGLLAFSFDRLNLHRLDAACLPHNEPSRSLLMKLGFVHEGLARKYLCINGAWQDHLLFGLIGEEWRAEIWQRRRKERVAAKGTTFIGRTV